MTAHDIAMAIRDSIDFAHVGSVDWQIDESWFYVVAGNNKLTVEVNTVDTIAVRLAYRGHQRWFDLIEPDSLDTVLAAVRRLVNQPHTHL